MPPKRTERNRRSALSRRGLLSGLGASGVAVVAGCTDMMGGERGDDGEPTETETEDGDAATTDVTDLSGRTVAVPPEVDEVVAVGPGALRMVAQSGGAEMVVGVEEAETQWLREVPYNMANPGLRDKPVIGGRGGDAEQIVALEPDVLFSTGGREELETLQERTDVPTLGIGTGELIDIGAPMLEDVWSFVGEVLVLEDVTDPMVSFLEETKADYLERTEGLEAGGCPASTSGASATAAARGSTRRGRCSPPSNSSAG